VALRPDTGRVGRDAEERAVAQLRARGYTILERNFRCRRGELDVVARDRDQLVFVEVRSRADGRRGTALEAVSAAKQRQVARVAEAWLAAHPGAADRGCRFDVVGVTGSELVVVRDAFRLGV
jgi:putative endonuclease